MVITDSVLADGHPQLRNILRERGEVGRSGESANALIETAAHSQENLDDSRH
jgi:hypothetical protein